MLIGWNLVETVNMQWIFNEGCCTRDVISTKKDIHYFGRALFLNHKTKLQPTISTKLLCTVSTARQQSQNEHVENWENMEKRVWMGWEIKKKTT